MMSMIDDGAVMAVWMSWVCGDGRGCVVMKFGVGFYVQVPREALFAGMLINFRSGKFEYSICDIFSKGHAEIFRELDRKSVV